MNSVTRYNFVVQGLVLIKTQLVDIIDDSYKLESAFNQVSSARKIAFILVLVLKIT